jgi:hypothetical protein
MKFEIEISSRRITKVLFSVVLLLTLANLAGVFTKFYLGHNKVKGLIPLFDVNQEANIPTFYSSLTLLFCAILLWIIATSKSKEEDHYSRHWKGLSIIFLYLSIDEAAGIHELLSKPLRELFQLGGFFYIAWVIPYAILTLIFGIIFRGFLLDLPNHTRRLFILSGAIFIFGALGIELIESKSFTFFGTKETVFHSALWSIQEFLEMLGVLIFIYALVEYASSNLGKVQISIG